MNIDFEKTHEEMLALLEKAKENLNQNELMEIINLINEYDKTTDTDDIMRIQKRIREKCEKKNK